MNKKPLNLNYIIMRHMIDAARIQSKSSNISRYHLRMKNQAYFILYLNFIEMKLQYNKISHGVSSKDASSPSFESKSRPNLIRPTNKRKSTSQSRKRRMVKPLFQERSQEGKEKETMVEIYDQIIDEVDD